MRACGQLCKGDLKEAYASQEVRLYKQVPFQGNRLGLTPHLNYYYDDT